MSTRRHFVTRTLPALALVPALAPALSRASTSPTGLWTFKFKTASLPFAAGYKVLFNITVGANNDTLLNVPMTSVSPLKFAASSTAVILPIDTPPLLTCRANIYRPNLTGYGTSNQLSGAGTFKNTFTVSVTDTQTGKLILSHQAKLSLTATHRTLEIEFLPYQPIPA